MSELPTNIREYKKLCMFLFKDQHAEIRGYSSQANLKFSQILRELVDFGLRVKRGDLPLEVEKVIEKIVEVEVKHDGPLCNGTHYCTKCQDPLSSNNQDELTGFISQEVGLGEDYEAIIRKLLITGMKSIMQEAATTGVKYCQLCSKQLSPRKKHDVIVNQDIFTFCDDCYFSDKYKDLIRKFL